uniref:Pogo transposable element with ZNF domain-like n=1 Tax=Saccoglossus kowalevskii TaxID=10224 RepID=A0ABM0GZ06_SACKO|nr:PREDICTED: pogo transposable element with ZNF domain-like [Saccoglossus kowalevskii]
MVSIRSTGAEKRHLTVILTVLANGTVLPPMIIFKGVRKLNLNVPKDMVVEVQKKGWCDTELMKIWHRRIWLPYTKGRQSLIIFDSFRGHLKDSVTNQLQSNQTYRAVIPGGCTSKLQPLDVLINKPFKEYLRKEWCEFIDSQLKLIGPGERPKTSSKQDIVNWVSRAWDKLQDRPDMVKLSFVCTGISSALDGSDDPDYYSASIQHEIESTAAAQLNVNLDPDDDSSPENEVSSDSDSEDDVPELSNKEILQRYFNSDDSGSNFDGFD